MVSNPHVWHLMMWVSKATAREKLSAAKMLPSRSILGFLAMQMLVGVIQ